MYAIEINLLKERTGYGQKATDRRIQGFAADSRGALFLGIAVGCSCLGLAVASLLVLNLLNQQLTAQEQEIDEQLAQLVPELTKIESMKAEEQRLQAETKALAGIFNQVKPWSATLQDIRDRVPAGLQITCIQQAATGAAQATPTNSSSSSTAYSCPSSSSSPLPSSGPSPSPSPSPAPGGAAATPAQPVGDLTIKGNALSFSDISDFVLSLQNSAFLKGDATQLIQAQRQSNNQTSSQANNTPRGPLLVEYQIQSSLSDVPASDLLQELNRKGAAGLVTRIGTLREKRSSATMTYDGEFAPPEFEAEAIAYPTLFGVTLTPRVNGILIAILGLGGAIHLGSQFTLPAFQSFQEHKTTVETKEAALQQQTEILEQLNQLIASLNQTRAVNAEVKTLFSDQRTLDTLLLDLNQLIVQTKAQLVTFTPDYSASGPVTDGSLGPELNGKLKRQVTLVAFEGNFDQTLAIIRNMERLQTFLVVKDFSAELPSGRNTSNSGNQPSQPQQDQIRSTFKLYAYVLLSPEEAAAAAQTTPAPPGNSEQPAEAPPEQ